MNPCMIATPKTIKWWHETHEEFQIKCKDNNKITDVLWIGDSIIEQIHISTTYKEILQKFKCLNFGIGGDRIENLLWRIENGELQFKNPPKIIVLHIGTNNISQKAEEIFEGIANLVEIINKKFQNSTIIITTLLPKGQFPNMGRKTNEKVNELLHEKYSRSRDFDKVVLVKIDENIVQKDGTISQNILHDYLHLTDEAYEEIFKPVYQKINEILK